MTTRFDAALFDLDGTLLDTLRDLGESMNRALATFGHPPHAIEDYRYLVGDGILVLATRALPEGHRSPEAIEALLLEYRRDYQERWNVHTQPYEGIPEMLRALQAAGLKLGVLSNKPHEMTRQCVNGYLSDTRFACVFGQRDEVPRKPDPAGALEAAGAMGVKPARVLYLGDTSTDMKTARAAGMFAVGVTWGFRPESELRETGAHAIVHHPSEIAALIHSAPP
ncbi:MAG: HAD family hydrolase [Verrucomicrobia bacterium]|nr:HAD family hydrolase [Verrucomicrobiota bacterium]